MKYKMVHFKKNIRDMNLVVGEVLLIASMIVLSVAVYTWVEKPAQCFQIFGFIASRFTFSNGNTITIFVENYGTVPSEIGKYG